MWTENARRLTPDGLGETVFALTDFLIGLYVQAEAIGGF